MDPTSSTLAPKSSCAKAIFDLIWDLDFEPTVPTPDYPPVSSIPRTSPERLRRATPKECPGEHIPSSSPGANDYLYDHTASAPTVLYLAYGSNLCAQTFLGQRGIRPISAVNVSAPSLRLTFDLPGYPYKEPCFANTAPRKLPKVPKHPELPPGLGPPQYPPQFPSPPPQLGRPAAREENNQRRLSGGIPTTPEAKKPSMNAHGDPEWDKGLIGVVYEVTPEDYATIVKTEGGGASYQDILCPCIPIPQKVGVPEKPPIPELPRPFLAHTLYAPRIPKKPGDDGDGDEKGLLDRLKDWWQDMLLQPLRPDPEYAQPSARYLKLIIDGAAEHGLPDDYQAWLGRLQPYTITTKRQAVGQYLFLGLVMPLVGVFFALSRWLADERGNIPGWLGLCLETVFHLVWMAYDRVFKPVFGDGERTEDEEEKKRRRRRARRVLKKKTSPEVDGGEEKMGLLDD